MVRRSQKRFLGFLVLAGVVTLAATAPAIAQTSTGSVRGYVRGDDGGGVSAATVTARSAETGFARSVVTNEDGFYFLPGLRPGRYEVTVQMIGYSDRQYEVQVGVGQTLELAVDLTQEAVELAGLEVVAAQADTRTSEVATNVSRAEIDNLPRRDRNFLSLAGLAPGIRLQEGDGVTKTFASGSQQAEQINVFIDGVSYKNDVLQGGVAGQESSRGNPFPQDAVQEFRVLTNNFKAEYEKASSAIITATTRTGGNAWQANGFLFRVNDGWVAQDGIAERDGLPEPEFSRLQGGASLSGPIIEDELFFFGTYEANLRSEPSDVQAINPDLLPEATQYEGRFDSEFEQHLAFGKLTWLPDEAHTVDASFSLRTESDIRGFGTTSNAAHVSYENAEDVQNDVYTGTVDWQYGTGPWLNEAQLTVQHYNWNPQPLNPDIPGQRYWGVIDIGGKDTWQDWTQNRLSLRNDLTYSGLSWMGDHVIKGGAYVSRLGYEAVKHFNANPRFDYDPNASTTVPVQGFIGYGDPSIDADNTQFGLYLQDDWTVHPNVVLNVGVRWDVETNMINNDHVTPAGIRDSLTGPLADQMLPIVDDLGGLESYFTDGDDRSPFLGAIQPRVGASWDLFGDRQTVVFGGFGVYYDRDIWNYMLDEEFRRQFTVLRIPFSENGDPGTVEWDPSYLDREAMLDLAQSGQAGAPEVFLIHNETEPPKSNHWNVGVRQAIDDYRVSLTYTGRRGDNGFAFVRASNWGALGPSYATAFVSTDEIRTWYDAVSVKVEKAMVAEARWGGALTYTWANGEERGEHFFSLDDRFNRPSEYPRWPSPGVQDHEVVAHGMVRLPYDVMLSGILELGSGAPVRGTDATDGWGPDQRKTLIFWPEGESFLGTETFASRNLNVRMQKDFTVAGGHSVSLVAEAFNALNHTNKGCFNVFLPPGGDNPDYGKAFCADEGRRLQVGLRYGFDGGL